MWRRGRGTSSTLAAWLEEWLAGVQISHPRTAPTYAHWARHIEQAVGEVRLSELDAAQLSRFFASGLSPKLAPESRRHVYQVLHASLNAAVKRGLLAANPLATVPKPRGAEMERPTLTVEECRQLLAECDGDRLGAMVVVGLYSGAREGELLALTWRDIDHDSGRMSITKSICDVKGQGLTVSPTKTRAGRRVVTLPPVALDALQRHRTRQNIERLAAETWSGDWVFATQKGTPMRRSNFLQRYWYPLLSRSRCPRIHFHDLRHTAALLMMREGHLPAVSRRLGHASTTITTELYGHAGAADDDRIAAGMSAVLGALTEPQGWAQHPDQQLAMFPPGT